MWKDEAWILDMLNACRRIQRYAQGVDGVTFLGDELRQDAIVRQLTVLGEAAKRVSLEYLTAHPEIPWQQIAGFRDIVVHQYERVDLPRVWQIVTEHLVLLAAQLAALVPPERL
jgi:uncharacterized protein with HEPN domain